jgi:hypothetical protein
VPEHQGLRFDAVLSSTLLHLQHNSARGPEHASIQKLELQMLICASCQPGKAFRIFLPDPQPASHFRHWLRLHHLP